MIQEIPHHNTMSSQKNNQLLSGMFKKSDWNSSFFLLWWKIKSPKNIKLITTAIET